MSLFPRTIEREKIKIGRLVFEKVLFFFKARATVLDFVWSFLEGTKKRKKKKKKAAAAEAAATL